MPSAEQDIRYLQGVVDELAPFLLSKELYWPISGPVAPNSSRLSLGSLLLTLERAEAWEKTLKQQDIIDRLFSQIRDVHDRWKTHWVQKAAREFPARLSLWKNYLDDYQEDPRRFFHEYAQRVEWRVILELLEKASDEISPDSMMTLRMTDLQLRKALGPAPFVWEKDLAHQFPRDPFWYLYGQLRDSKISG